MTQESSSVPPEKWYRTDGTVVACTEKVKVLQDNWTEIKRELQDALDDAVLMGCSVDQVKREYKRLIDSLQCQYKEQEPRKD